MPRSKVFIGVCATIAVVLVWLGMAGAGVSLVGRYSSPVGTYSSAVVPTVLVAESGVVSARPVGSTSIALRSLTARLTTVGGQPVAGKSIRMTSGTTTICSAITNPSGVAACSGTIGGVPATVVALGFDASFAGDALYAPSKAHGLLTMAP